MARARAFFENLARGNFRRRSDARLACISSARSFAPARSRSTDVFQRAHRPAPDRLCAGGGPGAFHSRAGALRPGPASHGGSGPRAAHACVALAGTAPDPDHEEPARLLARFLGRGEARDAWPLSQAPLARRSAGSTPDAARKTARKVIFHHTANGVGEIYRLLP